MNPPGDFLLSRNFTFYELTKTNNKQLQVINRNRGLEFEDKLRELADMLEGIRNHIGGPLAIHSGFRCQELNDATPGSSGRSQHLLGEAVDYSAMGQDTPESIEVLFQKTLSCLIAGGMTFGQIIKETAQREYGKVQWIHLSLGVPHRPVERCGQVLEMLDGKYSLIKQIPLGR